MKIKNLKKLNVLLTEYQGEISFSDLDKSSIGIALLSIRDKIQKYYWRNDHKKVLKEISNQFEA